MNSATIGGYLRRLAEVPTAPFREQWICERLDQMLAEIPYAQVEADRFGNRIVRLRKGNPKGTPLTFVAHLDHPGFIVVDSEEAPDGDGYHVRCVFEGRVQDKYFPGASVRLFRSPTDSGILARVLSASPEFEDTDNRYVTLKTNTDPAGAVLGMWDLSGPDMNGDIFSAPVCDDLAGCAALLAALHAASRLPDADLCVIFSRAEESGFCGVVCMLSDRVLSPLIPNGTTFISVETSGEVDAIKIGGGAVIRLGDKSSTFDGEVTDLLWQLASRNGLRARRVLMDRGTCEATAFVKAGLPAGGICIPLRNYHNMDQETGVLAREQIDLKDSVELSRLILAATQGVPLHREWSPRQIDEFALFLRKGREELAGETPGRTPPNRGSSVMLAGLPPR